MFSASAKRFLRVDSSRPWFSFFTRSGLNGSDGGGDDDDGDSDGVDDGNGDAEYASLKKNEFLFRAFISDLFYVIIYDLMTENLVTYI